MLGNKSLPPPMTLGPFMGRGLAGSNSQPQRESLKSCFRSTLFSIKQLGETVKISLVLAHFHETW